MPIQAEQVISSQGHRAADELFQQFEKMIMSGELKDGQTLPPEREIVETFGVSRTVVREAIVALSNKGLVEARPRFRPVVTSANFDTAISTVESVVARMLDQPGGVKNLFDTRAMVETMLAREAAKNANRADLEAFKTALDANEVVIEDNEEFFKTDIVFHSILYKISGNPVLRSVHKAYTVWLAPYWSKMPLSSDRNRINYESHKAIYEAILMRDPDEAEAAMRTHLIDAWNQVKETFETL